MRKAGTSTGFKAYGYDFNLLRIDDNIALYEQVARGQVFGYEVHVLRQEGVLWCPRSKSEFGRYAWCFRQRERAEKKYNELVRGRK